MKESSVEQGIVRWCRKHGLECFKLRSPPKGIPDRLVLTPEGKAMFIEVKRPGGRLSFHQQHFLGRLRDLGFDVGAFDTVVTATEFIQRNMEK